MNSFSIISDCYAANNSVLGIRTNGYGHVSNCLAVGNGYNYETSLRSHMDNCRGYDPTTVNVKVANGDNVYIGRCTFDAAGTDNISFDSWSNASVKIEWCSITNATGYNIEFKSTSGFASLYKNKMHGAGTANINTATTVVEEIGTDTTAETRYESAGVLNIVTDTLVNVECDYGDGSNVQYITAGQTPEPSSGGVAKKKLQFFGRG